MRDDLRQDRQEQTDRNEFSRMLQSARLLDSRLNHGESTGNYEHLSVSKDILKEIRDKFGDLTRNGYFALDLQGAWEVNIIGMVDRLESQKKAQSLKEDDEKTRKLMRS